MSQIETLDVVGEGLDALLPLETVPEEYDARLTIPGVRGDVLICYATPASYQEEPEFVAWDMETGDKVGESGGDLTLEEQRISAHIMGWEFDIGPKYSHP